MTSSPADRGRLDETLRAWADAMRRFAPAVLLAALLVTIGAAIVTIRQLGVQADIAELFSPDLPFRQADAAYRERFHHEIDTLLLVIDGETPEYVAQAGRDLAERLAEEPDLIEAVYRPWGGEFLEDHALLYLDADDLQDTTDRLASAQPFLGRLSQSPSLAGFAELLADALDAEDADAWQVNLVPVLDGAARAMHGAAAGRIVPLSWREVIDGSTEPADRRQLIVVQPTLDYTSLAAGGEAIRRIRAVAGTLGVDEARGLRLRITGSVALRYDELQTMRRGAGLSTLLAFVLVTVVLVVGLRSLRLILASLATLVAGLTWTAAFAAITVGHLNLISVAFGVLYIGLGIDYAIHLCLRYQALVMQGRPRAEAMRVATGDVGSSLILCALTTSIAFYAFVPTPFRGVSELGLIAGTGMLISLVANLTILPAFLSRVGPERRVGPPPRTPPVAEFVARHRMVIRGGAVVLGIATLPSLSGVRFDVDPLNLRDPASESVTTLRDLLADGSRSPWHAVVLDAPAETPRPPAPPTPVRERLEALPVVDRVVALNDFVPADQDLKIEIIDDLMLVLGTDAFAFPSDPAGPGVDATIVELRRLALALEKASDDPVLGASAANLLAKLRPLLDAFEDDADRAGGMLERSESAVLGALPITLAQLDRSLQADLITRDDLPSDLVEQWKSDDGLLKTAVFARDDLSEPQSLETFVEAVRDVAPDAIGAPVFNLAAAEAVIDSFRRALVAALAAIVVLLVIVLRRFTDALLVLIPVGLAGLLLAATSVLLGLPFNFANIIAVPLLLGLGVDSGIHMVLRRRANGEGSVLQTSTSRGVLFSALTTLAGFGAMSLSSHPGMASLGHMLTLGVIFVLFTTLIVLPALWSQRGQVPQVPVPSS